MKIFADLEIHSKYARAVSKEMLPENLAHCYFKKIGKKIPAYSLKRHAGVEGHPR